MDSSNPRSPFKFLDSYDESDRDIFFGREQETEALYEMVRSSRLVLIYGASGTGKTSLIRCGLANRFSKADWYALYIRRNGNLMNTLHERIDRAAITPLEPEMTLSESVESLYYDYYVPIYLIFDQFEELFILGSKEEQQAFFTQIAELVKPQLFCKVIFSIREEYIAYLSDFERVIPALFDHRIRVEKMSRKNLRHVVSNTCEAFDIALQPPQETVSDILRNLQTRDGVDLTNLQVYLDRLYRKDFRRRGQTDRPITFDEPLIQETGALTDVLAEFLDEQLAELDRQLPQPGMALDILFAMVTNNGTKKSVERQDLLQQLAIEKNISAADVHQGLEQLKRSRIVREWQETADDPERDKIVRLELAHDSLAGKIYERVSVEEKARRKIEQFVKERYVYYEKQGVLLTKKDIEYVNPYLEQIRLTEEEANFIRKSKQAVRRRRRIIVGAVSLFILVISALGLKAWLESIKFEALYLNSLAKQVVTTDPTAALRITESALDIRGNDIIRQDAYNLYGSEAFYRVLLRQDGPIKVLAVAPESDAILTVAFQRDSLLLWNLDGELQQIFAGHFHHVYAAAFSADGTKVLSGSADRTIRLWNRADGSSSQVFAEEHERPVEAVALSPDGTWALSGSSDGTVRLWEAGRENAVDTFYNYEPAAHNLAFSPDGRRFAYADVNRKIWMLELNGDTLQSFVGHADIVHALGFAPSGERILSGSADNTARLWRPGPDSLLTVFEGHEAAVLQVGFASGDSLFQRPLLLTASADGTARIWDSENFSLVSELRGHEGALTNGYFGFNGRNVITAGLDSTIRLWSYPQKNPLLAYDWSSRAIYQLRYHPSESAVLSAAREVNPMLWNFPAGTERKTLAEHDDRVLALAIYGPDSLLVSGARDGTIHIYNSAGELDTVLAGHLDAIEDLAVSTDYLISASADSTLRRYSWQGDSLGRYSGHNGIVYAVVIGNENQFFSGGGDSIVYRWQIDGTREVLIDELPGEVTALALTPDRKRLAIGLGEGTFLFTDLKGEILEQSKPHENGITEISYSPDGMLYLTASKDNRVKLWTADGLLVQTLTNRDEAAINTAVFSPDRRYILGGSAYGKAYLWMRPDLLDDFLTSGRVERLSEAQRKRFGVE